MLGKSCAFDHHGGVFGGRTGRTQPGDDLCKLRDAHVEHDGAVGTGEVVPVECAVVEDMSGDERDALRELAMREGNPGGRRCPQGRSDSWDHDEWNAVRAQHLNFLAAAAKYERIASLQSRDTQAAPGMLHEQLVDPLLCKRLTGFLAHKYALRIAPRAL